MIQWIASSECNSTECQDILRYDASTSTTLRMLDPPATWEMRYGSGKAQGIVGYDTIHLGDFRVEGQAFGASKRIIESFWYFMYCFSSRIKRLGSYPQQDRFFWYPRSFFRFLLCDVALYWPNPAQQSSCLVTL